MKNLDYIRQITQAGAALGVLLFVGVSQTKATTFTFDDEYYIGTGKSSTYSSIFGTTAGYGTAGIYQQTQDAAHGGVIVTKLSNGSSVPGEYVQDTSLGQELALFGWSQSLNNGQQVGSVYNLNNPINGTNTYFRYTVGGATTPFTFNGFDLRGSFSTINLSFTLQGYLGGALVDSDVLNVTGNTFSTFTENWLNVDTIEIVSTAGLPVNWGSGTLYMDNVEINDRVGVPDGVIDPMPLAIGPEASIDPKFVLPAPRVCEERRP